MRIIKPFCALRTVVLKVRFPGIVTSASTRIFLEMQVLGPYLRFTKPGTRGKWRKQSIV